MPHVVVATKKKAYLGGGFVSVSVVMTANKTAGKAELSQTVGA